MDTSEKASSLPLFTTTEIRPIWGALYRDFFKRLFDLTLAILLLPLVLPFLFVLIILIKIDSRGPVLYRSERIGKGGKTFNCLKLRTMCLDAHNLLPTILENDNSLREEYEKFCKLKKDPRITRVGKFLRSLSLDEFPQIFNVLKGEMSFVGPRPAFESELPKFGVFAGDYKKMLPGITGLWQISGRNDTCFQTRAKLDSIYSQKPNFWLDIKIILKTIPTALSRRGAY